MTDKIPKFPKLSDMETIKKEYVFTVKENGKVREIRKPINLFRSHRSCIIDCDNSDEQALTLAFEQGKLAGKKELVDGFIEQLQQFTFVSGGGAYLSGIKIREWLKSQLKEVD